MCVCVCVQHMQGGEKRMKGISRTLSTMIEDEDASLSEVIGNRAWTWDFTEIGFIMYVDLSEMCRR